MGKATFEAHDNLEVLAVYVGSNYVEKRLAKAIVNRIILEYFTNKLSFESFMYYIKDSLLVAGFLDRQKDIIFLTKKLKRKQLDREELLKQLGYCKGLLGSLYQWDVNMIAAELLWGYFRKDLTMEQIIEIGGASKRLRPKIDKLIVKGEFNDRHLSPEAINWFMSILRWQREAVCKFLDGKKEK